MKVIAVDFDGTLAHYEGFKGIGVYGEPVPSMLERVRNWIVEGQEVIIFTSRVFGHGLHLLHPEAEKEFNEIKKWLKIYNLPELRITAHKHPRFTEIWDDRAVGVERNTGRIITGGIYVGTNQR